MNKKLNLYTAAGIVFVCLFGSLSHFFYEWSGSLKLIGYFSPVSESTWEHIKLIFFPMLLYTVPAYGRLKENYPCILPSLLAGNLLGCALIPALFYTYTGILGYNLLFLDIAVFIFAAAAGFYCAWRLAQSCRIQKFRIPLLLLTGVLAVLFFFFTYAPPGLPLFQVYTPQA